MTRAAYRKPRALPCRYPAPSTLTDPLHDVPRPYLSLSMNLPPPQRSPTHSQMVKERRYCWMVGAAFDLSSTEQCPECCQPGSTHRMVDPPGSCGCFTSCPAGTDARDLPIGKRHDGHPCTLPAGHPPPCHSDHSAHCTIVAQALKEGTKP